jgi:hypothetical protein
MRSPLVGGHETICANRGHPQRTVTTLRQVAGQLGPARGEAVNAEVILLVAGCLFLGIAVVGGGFSAKEITVPLVSTNGRVASGVLGACLLCGAALLILSGATDRVAASPEPNPPAPQTITLTQSSPTNPSLSPSASAAPPATPTSPASTAGTAHPQEQIPDDDVPPGSVQSAGSDSAQQKLLGGR